MPACVAEDFQQYVGCRVDHAGVLDVVRCCVHHAVQVDDPLDTVERAKGFADGGKHVDCSGPCRLTRSIGVDIDTDLAESGTVHVTFTRPSGRPAS